MNSSDSQNQQGPIIDTFVVEPDDQRAMRRQRLADMAPVIRRSRNPLEPVMLPARRGTHVNTPDGTRALRVSDKAPLVSSIAIPTSYKQKVSAETDMLAGYWGWHGIIDPEYDLLSPFTILDTEAYLKQALERKLSLMFRNGFTVIGDNTTFTRYIERRLNQISFVSNQSFENFLKDVLWNLLVCSNCVVVKIRDGKASGGRKNEKNGNLTPVAGYVIVPPGTIFPYLDGYGQIVKWRRFFGDGRPFKDYDVDDIIHFKWKVKPGFVFGTPGVHAVQDDIYALRRLEENIELLLVNHLFPLFHVKVGSEKAPCEYLADGTSEVDYYRALIQNMPKEGVLVTDERVTVDVVGAANKGADYTFILQHYKQRIFTGLGVSAVDMGEADTGGGQVTAENVSQNLKDAIKAELAHFSQQVKLQIFKELFMEAPFDLSVQNATNDVSLEFHELDPDHQIKLETHASNLFNNHAITQSEYRRRLKMKPIDESAGERKDTHFERHVKSLQLLGFKHDKDMAVLTHEQALEQAEKTGAAGKNAPSKKVTTSHSRSAAGAVTKKKVVETPVGAAAKAKSVIQPSNQYGTNTGPHKARSSREDISRLVYDELMAIRFTLEDLGLLTADRWQSEASRAIDLLIVGEGCDSVKLAIKNRVSLTSDPDLLFSMIDSAVPEELGFVDDEELVENEGLEYVEEEVEDSVEIPA